MPRAPLPPIGDNATDRWFLEYSTPFGRHEIKFRAHPTAGIDAVTASLVAFVNAIKDTMFDECVFDKLRHANAGSNLSFPVTWVPIAGTYPTTNMERKQAANFVSVTGRTLNGRFVQHKVFGTANVPDDTFRFEANSLGNYADLITVVNGGSWVMTGKDAAKPIYNSYVNIGVHAMVQRKLRRQS